MKTLRIIFLQLIFVLFVIPFIMVEVNAAIVEKDHKREFSVEEDHILVKESKVSTVIQQGYQISPGATEGFTIFMPVKSDPDRDPKIQKTLDSIKVTDGNGNELEYKSEQTSTGNYELTVTNTGRVTYGNSYTLNLEYKSYGLLIVTGAIYDVFIPGFPENYVFEDENFNEKVSTSIVVPANYPEINFVSPSQQILNAENGGKKINIPLDDLIGNSTWMQIGKEQFFQFEINQKMPRTSNFPFAVNTFTLPVPRDITSGPISQKVYYTSISPEPYKVTKDDEENLIFTFKGSAAEDMNISIKGYASLSQQKGFEFTDAGSINDLTSEFDKYLKPAEYWEVEAAEIQKVANELKGTETDIYKIIDKTYMYVIDRIDYSFVKKNGLNNRQGALKTLSGGAAVCMEYSDLFITLLRAQGIPARAAFGYGFGTSDYDARQDRSINHQWAEVYIPKLNTWVNIDTTWGEFGNDLLGGDLNHFYSHVAAVDPETPSTSSASFFGRLDSIPDRDMVIDILAELPKESAIDQNGLLAKYAEVEGFDAFSKNMSLQNKILNDVIGSALGTNSKLLINSIKLLLFLSPIFLITSFIIWRKRVNSKKVKKN